MYILLLIPLLTSIFSFLLFSNKKLSIINTILSISLALVILHISAKQSEWQAVRDTEYFGGYVIEAKYFEPWDEEVPCRHTKYCDRQVPDSDGKGTHNEPYACGTEHNYDVDYYGPEWQREDSVQGNLAITEDQYNQYVNHYKNKDFVELNRKYHSIDGNEYRTVWKGKKEDLIPVTVEHEYVNRVQASNSILKFSALTPKDVKSLGLYEYPKVDYLGNTESILGPVGNQKQNGEAELQYLNSIYGAKYQVRLFLLVFKNTSIDTAITQESYWQRGNKNELVTCVGVDKDNKVIWSYVFSWTNQETFKTHLKYEVMKQVNKPLEVLPIIQYLNISIPKEWKRKEFKDFDYLSIKPKVSIWNWIIAVISILVCSTGILFGMLVYIESYETKSNLSRKVYNTNKRFK